MDSRFQNFILLATVIFSLNLCEPAECTTSRDLPPVHCEANDVIDAEQVPYFVDILLDPEVTFEEVCFSEKMLATGPMKEVIEELLPLLEFPYSESEICLGDVGTPESFSLCPYPWPSVRAASRVFRNYLDANWGPTSADLARQLLRDDEYSALFPILLHYLDGDWNEESERIAGELFEDSAAASRIRVYAAFELLRRNPWQYYERVLDACIQEGEPLKSSLAESLVYSSQRAKLGVDVRLVRLVLEVIEKKYYFVPVDLRTSYSLSFTLRGFLEFESTLEHLRTPYAQTGAPYDLRFRLEIEEVINQARAYIREYEVSESANTGTNDTDQ